MSKIDDWMRKQDSDQSKRHNKGNVGSIHYNPYTGTATSDRPLNSITPQNTNKR